MGLEVHHDGFKLQQIKINWPQEEIKKHFFMTDLGILAHLLGIEFIFHEYGNTMTQRRYIYLFNLV